MVRSSCLIAKDVEIDDQSNISWDLELISQDFADWVSNPATTPLTVSRVGMLSSFGFVRLLSGFVSDNLIQHLRLFVEMSSMLYYDGNQPHYAGYTPGDMYLVRAFVGAKVLKGLEKALASTALARASMNELKSLFLMLLGTIIAVSYSDQFKPSETVSDIFEPSTRFIAGHQKKSQAGDLSPSTFQNAHHQLLRRLAHHMIEIGHRVDLLNPVAVTNRILAAAARQWDYVAAFGWKQQHGNMFTEYESATVHVQAPCLCVANTNRPTLDFGFGDEIEILSDIPSGLVMPFNDRNEQWFDYLLPDLAFSCPLEWGSLGQGVKTSEFFINNHGRGCSYRFSQPVDCAFLETTDVMTVINAHEAQDSNWRLYRNSSVFYKSSQRLRQSSNFANPATEYPEATVMDCCDVCDGIVGLDGVCEPCTFTGVDMHRILDGVNDAISSSFHTDTSPPRPVHTITMQTYSITDPIYFESGVTYSVTKFAPDHEPYLTPSSTDSYEVGFDIAELPVHGDFVGKMSQWECRCTPPVRLVCSNQMLANVGGSNRYLV